MGLNPDEEILIKQEVEKNIVEFKFAIFVLNTYKWTIGIILLILGIGSFWAFDAILDKKVANRLQLINRIYIAESLTGNKNYDDAYPLLTSAWDELKNENSVVGGNFSKLYYTDILNVLSNLGNTYLSDDKFKGSSTWTELNADKKFRQFIEENTSYDQIINYIICQLKYDKVDAKMLASMRKTIDSAANTPREINNTSLNEQDYTDRAFWYPFILNVFELNEINARNFFEDASKKDSIRFQRFSQNLIGDLEDPRYYPGYLIFWETIFLRNYPDYTKEKFMALLDHYIKIDEPPIVSQVVPPPPRKAKRRKKKTASHQ